MQSVQIPLLIDTNPIDEFLPRPFHFEAIWTRDPRYGEVIKKAWKLEVPGSPTYKLCRKQTNTTSTLKKWNKEVYCKTRISEISNRLVEVQKDAVSESNARLEAKLQGELEEWLRRNEMLWRQKSREMWLKDGDKNSKFFHLSTIIRRKKNSIDAIKDEGGSWLTCKKEIQRHIMEQFSQRFTEEPVDFPPNLENLIMPSISAEDNVDLCQIPTTQEIKDTIFSMGNQKPPSPDGLLTLFYKKYWNVVGSSVTEAIQNFFRSGKILKEVNHSLLVLIPKNNCSSSVNHYRPKSLCNTVYKAISKIMVSKLRPLLERLVSPCQSAFVPGRWIAKNQLIVHELLHSFIETKGEGWFSCYEVRPPKGL